MQTYSVICFRCNGNDEVVTTGLSLTEAQEWCQQPETHGTNFFHGYTLEI